jgi:DNA-binding LacI/PurR family transcriptional regulator
VPGPRDPSGVAAPKPDRTTAKADRAVPEADRTAPKVDRPSGRPPAMTDVARLAGVSHQTVSRVLNNHPSVREATRDRVAVAIQELEYRRNSAARTLVTGRSQTIGVISFDTTLYGPASTLFGIELAAREAGYFVAIASLKAIDRASVVEAYEMLMNQSVGGIIVIAPTAPVAMALQNLPPSFPVVAVEGGAAASLPVVAVDQVTGAKLATQHLLDHGHRTVWHVTGPGDWLEAADRESGWRAALEAAGAPAPPTLDGDWSPRAGYAAGRMLAARDDVTAVFVANDQMALGLLRAMHEAGRRVPNDVSVVGFDDVPEAAYFMPPLTTIRQDFAEVGRRSLALLLQRLDSLSGPAERQIVPPELVARDSVAPPP